MIGIVMLDMACQLIVIIPAVAKKLIVVLHTFAVAMFTEEKKAVVFFSAKSIVVFTRNELTEKSKRLNFATDAGITENHSSQHRIILIGLSIKKLIRAGPSEGKNAPQKLLKWANNPQQRHAALKNITKCG